MAAQSYGGVAGRGRMFRRVELSGSAMSGHSGDRDNDEAQRGSDGPCGGGYLRGDFPHQSAT